MHGQKNIMLYIQNIKAINIFNYLKTELKGEKKRKQKYQ